MTGFLKTIGAAIMSAFRAMGRGLAAVARHLPFTGGGGAGPMEPLDVAAEVEELTPSTKPCAVADAFFAAADIAITHAALSLVDDRPASVPAGVDKALAHWLVGLTREQCEEIVTRSPAEVAAHFRGPYPIPGLPKLADRQPVAVWSPAPEIPADAYDDDFSVVPQVA